MAETIGVFDSLQVRLDHLAHEFVKSYGGAPTEPLICLARIAEQRIHFRGTEIARIDLDQDLAALRVDAHFIETLTSPGDRAPDMRERAFDEFAHRMRLARGEHEIV